MIALLLTLILPACTPTECGPGTHLEDGVCVLDEETAAEGDTDADTDVDSDTDADADSDTDADTDVHTPREFPEVTDRIAVFGDQFWPYTEEQAQVMAEKFQGTQKIFVSQSDAIRAYDEDFLVLHYHLGIWQQQPEHQFIIDGQSWGNDFEYVTKHEDWFWHNEAGERVRSRNDGKYLMNIANPELIAYWKSSILEQMRLGDYDGVFLDSSSTGLLNSEALGGEYGGEWMPGDERFTGTGALSSFDELGGLTWPQAYEAFMSEICAHYEAHGYACLPNVGNQTTTWDPTDYDTTSTGGMVEGAFTTTSERDWVQVANRVLGLSDGIVILQSYPADDDIDTRMYYLGSYLLVKEPRTYVNCISGHPFTWHPEWDLELGAPTESATGEDIATIAWSGVYRRRFDHGFVLVNPSDESASVSLEATAWRAIPSGGGPVNRAGTNDGSLSYEAVDSVELAPWSAAVFLNSEPTE
jgi:hypothetical protein